MNSAQSDALKRALENQVRRLNKKTAALEQWSNRISLFRLVDVLAVIVIVYLVARTGSTFFFWLTLLAGVVSFIALVNWHRKVDRAMDMFSAWSTIRRRHIARMELDWDHIPKTPSGTDHAHPFSRDFNMTGDRSVFQLLNTTTYEGAKERLRSWLIQKVPDIGALKNRKALVEELRPLAHFRDRLHLYATLAYKNQADDDWSMEELLSWLRGSKKAGFTVPLVILGCMATANITLLVLYLAGFLAPYVIFSFAAYILVYNFYSDKFKSISDEAAEIRKLLNRFRHILLYLESYSYDPGSHLKSFCSVYLDEDQKPSTYLKKIIRLASGAAIQDSDLGWVLLNMLVPWDMYFAKRLNEYKAELEPRLSGWVDQFYELEALNSLATFAWLNPEYTLVLPKDDKKTAIPVFEAEGLGHPLIPKEQKITNDVTIKHTGDIHLITGSNMAGKSTFLRTIGVNLALCFAGAPVNASRLSTIPFRLFSSINVTDSLNEGLSHFYAEVKRLRALLDELDQPHEYPLCFMVDEIYRGTNNRERLAGSEAFLQTIAGKDGIGLVSTHDLELANLVDEIPSLSNWHFVETIKNDKMSFEYKLKKGPCPSTNALKIMEMEGLPV